MANLYVPYAGKKPAPVIINGHRLLIMSSSQDFISDGLDLLGADRVKKIKTGSSPEEQGHVLSNLAKSIEAGVVIAPDDVDVRDVLQDLSLKLPWVH